MKDIEMYALKGTIVHWQAEEFLLGKGYPNPAEHPGYEELLAYRSAVIQDGETLAPEKCNLPGFWEKYGKDFQIEDVEMQVVCHEHKFAGRLDAKGLYKGKPAIIDFKTANHYGGDKKDKYFTQMAGYDIGTGGEAGVYVIIPLKSNVDCGFGRPIIMEDTARYKELFLQELQAFNRLIDGLDYDCRPSQT